MGGEILGYASRKGAQPARQPWLPVETLVRVEHGSPEYSGERNRVGVFYAQSWLLTHMLMMSEKFRGNFDAFVTQVNAFGDSAAAFAKAYGFGVPQMEKELKSYYAGNRVSGVRYKARFERVVGLRAEAATHWMLSWHLPRLKG
ncbi:MAG: hypothetical protein WKF37_09355 [Bryobacteraceae bacterium]